MPSQKEWKRREKMIVLNNVTRSFADLKAISEINVSVSKGDIVGVVGKMVLARLHF